MLHKWNFIIGAVVLVVIIVAVAESIPTHKTGPGKIKMSSKQGGPSNKTLLLNNLKC